MSVRAGASSSPYRFSASPHPLVERHLNALGSREDGHWTLGGGRVEIRNGCVVAAWWVGADRNRVAEEFALRLQRETGCQIIDREHGRVLEPANCKECRGEKTSSDPLADGIDGGSRLRFGHACRRPLRRRWRPFSLFSPRPPPGDGEGANTRLGSVVPRRINIVCRTGPHRSRGRAEQKPNTLPSASRSASGMNCHGTSGPGVTVAGDYPVERLTVCDSTVDEFSLIRGRGRG